MKNVALLTFPLSKIGGVTTVRVNVKKGLQDLGYTVLDCQLSSNTKTLPEPDGYDKVLGFMTPAFREEFRKVMSNQDLLIFTHPCPTITKAFSDPCWQDCYKTGKPNIAIAHDPYLLSNYPWFQEVKPYVTGVACIQRKSYDVISKYFDNCTITNHFLDLSPMGEYRDQKEDLCISPSQFKTWKYIDLFIKSIPFLKNVKTEIFNGGIEYHYMSGSLEKRKEKYKDANGNWIWEKALASGMTYRGFVPQSDIELAFKRAKSVIDLSVGELGNKLSRESATPSARQTTMFSTPPIPTVKPYRSLNYVILEAMLYGSVPVARKHSLLDGIITESNLALVSEDDLVNSTATWINDITKYFDNYRDMIKRNHELLKTHYDNVTNTKKLLELLK
jgi:hypothetical protein